jgi:hypothetical protein
MEFKEDFVVPPVQNTMPTLSEALARQKAFYGAATSGEDPVESYENIYQDLVTKGQSLVLDNAKSRWTKEQDTEVKAFVGRIIEDPNVDKDTKKELLEDYSNSGFLSKSLKDKYTEIMAVYNPEGATQDSIRDQESTARTSLAKQAKSIEAEKELDMDPDPSFVNWLEGAGYVTGDLIKSFPASIWAGLNAAWKLDPVAGQEILEDTMQAWGASPEDVRSQEARQRIAEKLEFLEIPYQTAYKWMLDLSNSPDAAIIFGSGAELLTGAWFAKLFLGGLKHAPGIARTKPTGPLRTTNDVNPKAAADLAVTAVQDAEFAKSLGTDRGSVLAEYALPKAFSDKTLAHISSIDAEIAKEFRDVDVRMMNEISLFKYDPSLHNATLRETDYRVIRETIAKSRGPAYMQANSSILPTMDGFYEGKAVFGKDKSYFFNSRTDAIDAYNDIKQLISNTPEELGSTVSIVDRLTGEKYTPETLLKESKYYSKDDIIKAVPSEYEGIPVRIETIFDAEGKEKKGRVFYDEFGQPTYVSLNVAAIKKAYSGLSPETKAKIESPDEFVRFVLEHEMAHTKLKKAEGQTDKEYEAAINNMAIAALNKIKASTPNPKQLSVEWEWKRQYDDIGVAVFGPEAVSAKTAGGFDISAVARGKLSQWLFGGRGIFPRWFEKSAARSAPRSAHLAQELINIIQDKIASLDSKTKKNLSDLINEVEKRGVDELPSKTLVERYGLTMDQAAKLQIAHGWWRRVNDYNYLLLNWQKRNELLQKGFKQGLFVNNNYKGGINPEINFIDQKPPAKVWDFDLNREIEFQLDRAKPATDGAFDLGGRQLAALEKPYVDDSNGNIYSYVLLGKAGRADILPDVIVPRVPGYSPVKYNAKWFVDIQPTKAVIDGYTVEDFDSLRGMRVAKAAVDTKKEAEAIQAEFLRLYPRHSVHTRLERGINYQRITEENEIHAEILRNAQQRGERLKGAKGDSANIEDRLQALVETTQNITRQGAIMAWEQASREAFVNAYGTFLRKREFPNSRSDIIPPRNPDADELVKYKEALTIFDHFSKIKSFGTLGDRVWADSFHTIADIFENSKITSYLAPYIRNVADKGNMLANTPRKLASALYISMNPQRQWLIQPAQLYELALATPKYLKHLVRAQQFAIAAAELSTKGKQGPWYALAKKTVGMDDKEFDLTVKGLVQSGLIEAVDLHQVVSDVLRKSNGGLDPTLLQKSGEITDAAVKGLPRISREWGFDKAERFNRVGLWLIAKDKWIESNPGKDWTTREAIEDISFDEYNLAGAMGASGSYPYQRGMLSFLMQFAAISQKLTQNLVMQNTANLGSWEKARLVAVRATMWGAQYGVPGGAMAYHYVDQSEDPNVQKYAQILKRGIADRALNYLFMALTSDPENPDLMSGRSFSPYGDYTTGFPYYDVVHAMYDSTTEGQMPRLPAVGATTTMLDTINMIHKAWEIREEMSPAEWEKVFTEATRVAAGMNNVMKAYVLYGTGDLVTKNGNNLELQAGRARAVAQIFGVSGWKEHDLFNAMDKNRDRDQKIKGTAEEVNRFLVRVTDQVNPEDYESQLKQLNSLITVVTSDWTQQERRELERQVMNLQRQQDRGAQASMLMKLLSHNVEVEDKKLAPVKNFFRQYGSPEINELIDTLEGKGNP